MNENSKVIDRQSIYLLLTDGSLIGPLTLSQMEDFGLNNAKGILAVRLGLSHWFSLPGGGGEWVKRAKFLLSQIEVEEICAQPSASNVYTEYLTGLAWGTCILTGIGCMAGFGDARALLASALLAIAGFGGQLRLRRNKG